MNYATNIEHNGECPDCQDLEKKLNKEYSKYDVLQESKDELLQALKEAMHVMDRLLSYNKIVNLDETIAYYESLIKKHSNS